MNCFWITFCLVSWTLTDRSHACKCGLSNGKSLRIIGGKAAENESYPWMAYVYKTRDTSYCGGSIITNLHIVTAGHCVGKFGPSIFRVIIGNNGFKQGQTLEVKRIFRHEKYLDYKNDDIAILELKEPLQFSAQVFPICLPPKTMVNLDRLKVVGWGRQDPDRHSPPTTLQELDVDYIENQKCKEASDNVHSQHLCAGVIGKGITKGDSGGPLMHQEGGRFYLVGIASFVPQYCVTCGISVFTRVTQYLDWIADKISPALNCLN